MKNCILFFTCMLLGVVSLQAQNDWTKKSREEVSGKIKKDDSDTSNILWRKGLNINVNLNQGSLTNWAAGGDEFTFSLGSTLYGWAFYKKGRRSWDNVADLAFGYVKTTSLGSRKSDDRIDLTTKYGYDIGKNWYVSGLLNLRTQFANGFQYPSDTSRVLLSRIFAPAYVLLSPGFDYKPDNSFSLFISPVTSRFVFVMDDFLANQGAYGVDTGRHFRYEVGAYLSANYVKSFAKNMTYKGRLDLFSDYRHNPQNVDIFFTNALELKVNKWISALLTLDMIYDDDVKVFMNKENGVMGPRLQVKQVIGVGFAAKL